MSRRVTAILPAGRDWEVWGCNGENRCSLQSTSSSIASISDTNGSTVFGIPNRYCRTIAMLLPKSEKGLLRKMVQAQLERRGICRDRSDAVQFECHVIEERGDKTLVSVDVLPEPLPAELSLDRARCYTAAGRAYSLPKHKAVILAEQGRLIFCVGHDGNLLHSQVVSNSLDLDASLANEINLAVLSLEGSGLIDNEIEGVEVWGEFPPGQLAVLEEHLDVEIDARPRPAPSAAADIPGARHLLPASALKAKRASVKRLIIAGVCLSIAGAYGFLIYSKYQGLKQLERRAARYQKASPDAPDAGAVGSNKAIGARWAALRNVLESKRYPMMHLSRITKAIPPGGVVISSFSSSVTDLNLSGTARSAKTAYAFFAAMHSDEVLGVYNWKMPQPGVSNDGRASFSIKGKMK